MFLLDDIPRRSENDKKLSRRNVDYTSSDNSDDDSSKLPPPPPPKDTKKKKYSKLSNNEHYTRLHEQYMSALETLKMQQSLYKTVMEGNRDPLSNILLGEGALQAMVHGVHLMHKELMLLRENNKEDN